MNSRRLHHVLVQPKAGGLTRLSTAVASSDCLSSTDDSDSFIDAIQQRTKVKGTAKAQKAQVPREHICIVELCMHTHTHVHVTRTRDRSPHACTGTWGDTISLLAPHANVLASRRKSEKPDEKAATQAIARGVKDAADLKK